MTTPSETRDRLINNLVDMPLNGTPGITVDFDRRRSSVVFRTYRKDDFHQRTIVAAEASARFEVDADGDSCMMKWNIAMRVTPITDPSHECLVEFITSLHLISDAYKVMEECLCDAKPFPINDFRGDMVTDFFGQEP